jgi:hypothetical protein
MNHLADRGDSENTRVYGIHLSNQSLSQVMERLTCALVVKQAPFPEVSQQQVPGTNNHGLDVVKSFGTKGGVYLHTCISTIMLEFYQTVPLSLTFASS